MMSYSYNTPNIKISTIQFKRARTSDKLPEYALYGEPIYCSETNSLYIGQGANDPIKLLGTLGGGEGSGGDLIELRASDGYLQWKYKSEIGNSSWRNLISLDDITGPKGEKGDPVNIMVGDEIYIQENGVIVLPEYSTKDHTHNLDEIPYTNDMYPNMATLQDAMNELLYVAPQITTFNSSKASGTYEIGSTVLAPILFSWGYNKTIVSQTFDGISLEPNIKIFRYNKNVTSDKSFTLKGNDGKKDVTRSLSFNFRHRRYWGSTSVPEIYNSDFILGLSNKEFATGRAKGSFNINIGEGQYFYYCYPESWGSATFNAGGFDGGVDLVATIPFTNASGNTTRFYIYKSENPNLGSTNFIVK